MKIGPYYYPERLTKDQLRSAKQLAKKAKKRNANTALLDREYHLLLQYISSAEEKRSPSQHKDYENPFPDGFVCGTPLASMEHKKTSPSIVHNESQKLYDICVKNIEMCEDIKTVNPSCKQELLEHIKRGLLTADESINKAMQKEEYDRERIALFLVINTAFLLLQSGRFHIYRGWLDPYKCGASLLNVYEYCMDVAVLREYITETEKKTNRQELQEAIEEVG